MRKRDATENERIKLPKEKEILNKFIRSIQVNEIIPNSAQSISDIKTILNDTREINEIEICKIERNFKKLEKKELFYRGKFQIFFLKKFVADLINKVNKENYLGEYGKNINIDINNNIITYLSTYAETTEKLKKFLQNIKKMYIEN